MGAGTVLSIAKGAKEAQRELARAGGAKREAALREISSALRENVQSILEANRADIAVARENGMAESMIDRLTLTAERIEGMAKGVDDVAAMPDPVGRVLSGSTRPNGLRIEKVTVPLGVIGIIYEARPNVTSDAAALCLKAGNAVILRQRGDKFKQSRGESHASGGRKSWTSRRYRESYRRYLARERKRADEDERAR